MLPEKMQKADIRMVNDLDYVDVKFPVSKKDYSRTEQKITFWICFVMKMVWFI